jgi:hypothetical protein
MVSFVITKTQEVPDAAICREDYADSLWDERGVLLEHYTPQGNTITSASYSDLFDLQSDQSDVDF